MQVIWLDKVILILHLGTMIQLRWLCIFLGYASVVNMFISSSAKISSICLFVIMFFTLLVWNISVKCSAWVFIISLSVSEGLKYHNCITCSEKYSILKFIPALYLPLLFFWIVLRQYLSANNKLKLFVLVILW